MSESAIPSSHSQPAPRQPQLYSIPISIPKREHEHQNDHANDRRPDVQPQSPKYELPQSHKYQYPDQPPNHEYEYPDVRVVNGGYSALVRPPLNKNESENSGYTSLINCQKTREEASVTGRKNEADRLLYVDAIDGDYTQLVRQPLKDNENEAPRYQPLLNNGQRSEVMKKPMQRGREKIN